MRGFILHLISTIILINLRSNDIQVTGTSDHQRALVISNGGFVKVKYIKILFVPSSQYVMINFKDVRIFHYEYFIVYCRFVGAIRITNQRKLHSKYTISVWDD